MANTRVSSQSDVVRAFWFLIARRSILYVYIYMCECACVYVQIQLKASAHFISISIL
jgi:hypothetical protein